LDTETYPWLPTVWQQPRIWVFDACQT